VAYACPVCATVAPDGEHLAHHLAIVAMTRGGEHESWLDEHAPGWQEASPEELAATATDHAEQVEHELADEAAGGRPDVGHAHDHGGARGGQPGGATPSTGAGGDETAAVLAEAREITQRMLEEDDEPADGDGGGDADGGAAAGPDEDAATDADGEDAAGTDSDEADGEDEDGGDDGDDGDDGTGDRETTTETDSDE
jgi:hypothetical protein